MAKRKNALELVPVKSRRIGWVEDGGLIKLKIYRNHWYDKIMHRVFKTPLEVTIDLDEIGSHVWRLIDGERTIADIGNKLQEELGEKVEPTYPRLIMFMRYLYNESFIYYRKDKK
jgi:hypothetical protein